MTPKNPMKIGESNSVFCSFNKNLEVLDCTIHRQSVPRTQSNEPSVQMIKLFTVSIAS